MHAYATDEDRTRTTLYLALVAGAVVPTLAYVASLLARGLPSWLTSTSTLVIFGALFWVFNRHAWRWALFSRRLSAVPDLQGTWAGVVHSTHDDKDTPVVVYIRQTWVKISIRLETERSSSVSLMAAVNSEEAPAEQGLNYEYLNEPIATAVETMRIHRGTAHLRLSPDCTALEGSYYTGRDRLNLGTMKLTRVASHPIAREEALKLATPTPIAPSVVP